MDTVIPKVLSEFRPAVRSGHGRQSFFPGRFGLRGCNALPLQHAVETGSRAIDQWEVNICARLDDLSRSRATGRASLKGLLDFSHRL